MIYFIYFVWAVFVLADAIYTFRPPQADKWNAIGFVALSLLLLLILFFGFPVHIPKP